jgi:hypothetical protein
MIDSTGQEERFVMFLLSKNFAARSAVLQSLVSSVDWVIGPQSISRARIGLVNLSCIPCR